MNDAQNRNGRTRKTDAASNGQACNTVRRKFFHDKIGVTCMVFFAVLCLIGVFAPLIAPYDPAEINVRQKFAACSLEHLLGTDHLGRDILARLIYGIRTTLGYALSATGITVGIGLVLGMTAGYVRGVFETVLMRACDMMMSFPAEVMILAIVGMLGPGAEHIVLACVIAKCPWYTRMFRTMTRDYTEMNYILFARAAGFGVPYIVRRHLLHCIAGEAAVLATMDTGAAVLMISTLSFLGLGVQPPIPEWGMMLSEAKEVMALYPGQMFPPGLCIASLASALHFIGDSLRDAIDPWHDPVKKVEL